MSIFEANWGERNWGDFYWGWVGNSPGKSFLGHPADAPTQFVNLRILRPFVSSLKKQQPKARSAGMEHFAFDKSNKEHTITVPLKFNKAGRDAFVTFFSTLANGSMNRLYYTDPFDVVHVVRIIDNELDLREEAYNKWVGSVTLRKEG